MTEAWIVKETGENRVPVEGEYYLSNGGKIVYGCGIANEPRSILSVTPVPTKEEMKLKFHDLKHGLEKWVTYDCMHLAFYGFTICYDLLFGEPKQEEDHYPDDWF